MTGLYLPDVVQALARAVEGAAGVRRCYPFVPARVSEVPCAYVSLPDRVLFNRRFGRGAVEATIPVTVVVGSVDQDASQAVLWRLASNAPLDETGRGVSVKDAIEADRTLGDTCGACLVTEANDPRSLSVAEATYIAIDLLVTIHA